MSFILEPLLDIAKNEVIDNLPGGEFASKTAEIANNAILSLAEKVPVLGPMVKKGEQLFGWGKNKIETSYGDDFGFSGNIDNTFKRKVYFSLDRRFNSISYSGFLSDSSFA